MLRGFFAHELELTLQRPLKKPHLLVDWKREVMNDLSAGGNAATDRFRDMPSIKLPLQKPTHFVDRAAFNNLDHFISPSIK